MQRIEDFLNLMLQRDHILYTLGVLCLAKIILFSLTVDTPQMGWEWEIRTIPPLIFASAGFLAILLAPAFLFQQRNNQLYYGLVVNAAISIGIMANRVYNMFFQSYISPETIMLSHEALSMKQALLSTMRFWELLWLVDLALIVFLLRRSSVVERKPLFHLFQRGKKFSLVALTGFFVFSLSLNYTQHHGQQNLKMRESGILLFYLREAALYFTQEEENIVFGEDIQAIKHWFARHHEENEIKGEAAQYYGKAEGKNLIILQVEALQQEVIGKTLNDQEITPNLNRLKEESVYFKNCFDQVDMATADAEVLVNLSQYPLSDVSVYMRHPDNYFNSLARTLHHHGYRDAAVFHGFRREFYNRQEAYPNLGFNRYFSRRHFEKDEVYNGLLGDKTFLTQTASLLEELNEPFYSFIITLTSHHPFNYLEGYEEIDVDGYEGTIVGDYIRSIHYTDAAIGIFYDLLEEQGLLDRSLLLIYGDHVAFHYNEIDWEALNCFFGADMRDPLEQLQRHQVPVYLRFPGGNVSKLVSENAGMIDIFPTIANALAVDNPYLMGRDLLNTEEDMVILKRGSFIKGNYLYHAPTKTMYDLETGALRVVADDHHLVRKAEETLRISRKIYRIDFFRVIQHGFRP